MANMDADPVRYDPWDPDVIDDPYPHYKRLRDLAPAYHVETTGYWVLSRYDDVLRAVRDWETFSSQWGAGGGSPSFMGGGDGYRSSAPSMIASDPPDHTRLRRIVQREFTPSNISRWEQRIRAYADGLVRDFLAANERGEADLMRDIAIPLPSIAIAEILGIPPEDRDEFKEMTETALGGASLDPEVRARAAGGGPNLFEYFERVVAEKRKNLGDDLVSLFIRASERGEETLTHEEIIAQCHLFLIGGHETTTNVIGNAVAALLEHEDQFSLLRANHDLLPAAIEEFLRYDGSSLGLFRFVKQDVDIAGTTVPAGAILFLLYNSANRDERHYEDPDALVLERNPRDHLAFSGGVHLCIGAPLARLELRIALEAVLDRTKNLRLAGEPVRNRNILTRGFHSLPVAFEPA